MPKPTNCELENRFRYHKPGPAAVRQHEVVTESTLALAKRIRDVCPEGLNLSIALTSLEDVRMRANAAIACDSPADGATTDGGQLDAFDELVANYKAARDNHDLDKAVLFRNEIEAYPDYFDELVNRIP
jgi:hypothetical protein